MNARTKILILALFQAGTMLAWAGYHERLWRSAPTFRIALAPVDPFDMLRGRYFILNPRDATIGADPARPESGPVSTAALDRFLGQEDGYQGRVQIAFCPAGPIRRICGVARPGAARPALPGALWATGSLSLWRQGQPGAARTFSGNFDLELDRFFLPNRAELPAPESAPGWELEVVHRPGQLLLPKRLWFGGRPLDFGSP